MRPACLFLMKPLETKSSKKQTGRRIEPGLKTRPKKAVAGKKDATTDLQPACAKRIRNYKKLAKKELSEAFPEIVDVLIKEAKKGSLTHTKFLFELGGGKDKPAKRGAQKREPSLAEILLGEVAKRREEELAELSPCEVELAQE